jgi:uroporphyrinogen-III synthase
LRPDPVTRLLVTRPQPDAGETIARLDALGIEGVATPLLERAALHAALPDPAGLAAIALTSANALRALDERGALRPYLGLRVFTVGEKTAAVAHELGFVDIVTAGGTAEQLVAEIGAAQPPGPVFYPAARHQAADLAGLLKPLGVDVVTARVYEMRAVKTLAPAVAAGLSSGAYAGALFYSRRTAEAFVALAAPLMLPEQKTRLGVLCLSEQVAEPLLAAHFIRAGLAEHPSEEAMMALALAFVRDQNTA